MFATTDPDADAGRYADQLGEIDAQSDRHETQLDQMRSEIEKACLQAFDIGAQMPMLTTASRTGSESFAHASDLFIEWIGEDDKNGSELFGAIQAVLSDKIDPVIGRGRVRSLVARFAGEWSEQNAEDLLHARQESDSDGMGL
jgi:hypothetical protein